MTKKFLLYCFLIGCTGKSFSQATALQFTIQNQYEGAVKEALITVIATGDTTLTDNKGKITINASAADFIRVDHKGYDTAAVSLATINKNNILKVKKNFTWTDLLTPMFYIINGGLWLILFIIFAETGLFAGFFLPGDSLLFVAGIYNRELIGTLFHIENEYLQLTVLWLLISVAGIIGNSVGYWFGKKVGPAMYTWKDNLLFKKKYLREAHDFYEKYGGGAIIIARFLPIVRTFAPIVAGIVAMDQKKFTFYNIVGCFAWVLSMLVAGHFLQKWILAQFGFDLKEHLEVIVIGIILLSTAPLIIKLLFGKKKPTTAA